MEFLRLQRKKDTFELEGRHDEVSILVDLHQLTQVESEQQQEASLDHAVSAQSFMLNFASTCALTGIFFFFFIKFMS